MAKDLGKVCFTSKGAWEKNTEYEKLDLVVHEGSSYVALQDVPASAVTPPNNTGYWLEVATGAYRCAIKGGLDPDFEESVFNENCVKVEQADIIIEDCKTAVEGAEKVNASLSGNVLTVTNRDGTKTSVNTQGNSGVASADGIESWTDLSDASAIPDDTTERVNVAGAKATATAIQGIKDNITNLGVKIGDWVQVEYGTAKNRYIKVSTDAWNTGGTSYIVDIQDRGANVDAVKITANSNRDAVYAFLIDNNITTEPTSLYVEGTGLVSVEAGKTVDDIEIPTDAKYLYLYNTYSTTVMLPEACCLGCSSAVQKSIDEINEKIDVIEPESNKAYNEIFQIETVTADGYVKKAQISADESTIFTPSAYESNKNVYYFKVSAGDKLTITGKRANTSKTATLYVCQTSVLPAIGVEITDVVRTDFTDKSNPETVTYTAANDGYVCVYYYASSNYWAIYPYCQRTVNRIDKLEESILPTSGKKILMIGDSWGRDTVRLLWGCANDAGIKDLLVCDSYQGACSLYNQFKAMDDATRHYTHSTWEQYIQGVYQLWTYNSVDPSYEPVNSEYNNGKCGVNDGTAYGKDADGNWAGMTLAQILASQDWDVILIRLHMGDLIYEEHLSTNDDDKGWFDILDFIARMEEELTDACKAKVEWGITNTWTYPQDCERVSGISKDLLTYAGVASDAEWKALSQEKRNQIFKEVYVLNQQNFQKVALRLGDKCKYMVNTSKAIEYARNSTGLGDIGFGLCRSKTDTHLSDGIAKYLCGCCLAYELFGVLPSQFSGKFIPSGSSDSGTDGDDEVNPNVPTFAQCLMSRKIAYNVYADNYQVE